MERLGHAAERTLSALGTPELGQLSTVTTAWPAAVGDAVARNAWPRRIGRDGTLHVATVSSVWAFELDRLAPVLLDRLSRELGEAAPAALRFAPGAVPEPPPAPAAPSPRRATPAARGEATRVAAAIDDPELRALVERAAAAGLARSPRELA
jgi:hypothetical protein